MPDLFEQLMHKYQPVFDTIKKEGGQVQSLQLDGNQLYLKATAKSAASMKRIRDAIKTVDPELNELKHDIEPLLSGFEQFILRGNVVDMAIGIVIGAASSAIATALTKDLLTPLIAALFGKPDFSAIYFTMNQSVFAIGDFMNTVVSFVLVASAMYFFVVTPVNALVSCMRKGPVPEPRTKKCHECFSEIPIEARRCSHCTQPVGQEVAVG
jgi:large conductance mechanosensitive channel